MTDDRWARLDSILQAALVRPPEAREPFVREACGDDAALRDEVLSLLKHDESATNFLEESAPAVRARLQPGQHLGPYRIEAFIDAGGMGEVYRATDTRLDREVAVKVLPRDVGGDPERRQRFEREARAIGSLKHPNICPLFDVGEHEGQSFLVMELVEGETLARCIERGPLPINQALRYAIEIASALDRAHRQAIVHRDLKPANIIVTKAGVKLVDFGLAKSGPSRRLRESALPTRAQDVTADGTILGTLQYMSPEQVEGREADARSDIFAFGAVLYEMVTGRKAFAVDTQAGLINAILRDQPPPMSILRSLVPPSLDRVVKTCLEKDPDERWQSAADLARQLRWVADEQEQPTQAPSTKPRRGMKRVLWATAWLGAGAFLAVIAVWALGPASRATSHLKLDITPAEALHSNWTDRGGRPAKSVIALSPDGRTLVFAGIQGGRRRLYRRALDREEPATPIAGTEDADTPFFSPGGDWIGFRVGEPDKDPGEFRKVPLDGGPVQQLASTPDYGAGATWGDDGVIVFVNTTGLKKIPAAGGEPSVLTTLRAGEAGHHHPHALPGGRGWLYTVLDGAFAEDVSVWMLSARTGESRLLIKDAADARYVPTGHIVFARGGKLMAAPFDLGELRISGLFVTIIDSVLQALNGQFNANRTGTAQYAFSETGNLAYVTGGINHDRINSLQWFDFATKQLELLLAPPKPYAARRLSPDGQRITFTTRGAHETAVWVYGLNRGDLVKLPFEGRARFPLFAPDSQRVVFSGEGKNLPFDLYLVPADGSGPATPLNTGGGGVAGSWDTEGNLIFVKPSATLGWGDTDIMRLNMKDKSVSDLLATRGVAEFDPTLSPNGQWLAYTSEESGKREVYVRPYPEVNKRKFPVSTGGGRAPRWVLGGNALLYQQGDVRVMRVDVIYTPDFRLGSPKVVWEVPPGNLGNAFPVPFWDVTHDGRRLLGVTLEDPTPPPPKLINVVQGWFDELRAKMRAGGKGSRP
jgi:serine/threonine-protein kinase